MGKKLKKPTTTTTKPTRGGARPGSGRKPIPDSERQHAIKFLRCRAAVSDALDEFLASKNAERAAKGLGPVSFSHWAREVLLHAAGRQDLSEAASAADLRAK